MTPGKARLGAVLWALVVATLGSACSLERPDSATQIDSAYLVLGPAQPTGARVGGRDVSLPDYWPIARRRSISLRPSRSRTVGTR